MSVVLHLSSYGAMLYLHAQVNKITVKKNWQRNGPLFLLSKMSLSNGRSSNLCRQYFTRRYLFKIILFLCNIVLKKWDLKSFKLCGETILNQQFHLSSWTIFRTARTWLPFLMHSAWKNSKYFFVWQMIFVTNLLIIFT